MDNESFVTSLMELRNRYQAMAHQCGSQASHAKEQIYHVNALLADQLVWQHNQQPVSIQALHLNENNNRSLTAPVDINSDKFSNQINDVDEIDVADAADELAPVDELELDSAEEADARVQGSLQELEQDLAEDSDPSVQDSLQELEMDEINEPGSGLEKSATTMVLPELETIDELESRSSADLDSDDRVHTQPGTRPFPPLKTPMLPQFQHLTKFQAVEGILQQKAGSILHIDYIIRALHGNLPEDDVLAEKGRTSKTLSDGAKRGLWQKVPGETGCYTCDLNQVDLDKAAKANRRRQVGRGQK